MEKGKKITDGSPLSEAIVNALKAALAVDGKELVSVRIMTGDRKK